MTGKAAPPGNPERILKQKLGRFSGGRILDVATGHGDFALLLVRVFADYEEIVGIDTNDQALKEARAAARRAGHNPIPRDCHPLSAEENGGCTCLPQSGLCPKAAGHAGVPGRLVRRIERIKAHIRRYGFLPASSLVCLGRKAGTGPPRAPKTK